MFQFTQENTISAAAKICHYELGLFPGRQDHHPSNCKLIPNKNHFFRITNQKFEAELICSLSYYWSFKTSSKWGRKAEITLHQTQSWLCHTKLHWMTTHTELFSTQKLLTIYMSQKSKYKFHYCLVLERSFTETLISTTGSICDINFKHYYSNVQLLFKLLWKGFLYHIVWRSNEFHCRILHLWPFVRLSIRPCQRIIHKFFRNY